MMQCWGCARWLLALTAGAALAGAADAGLRRRLRDEAASSGSKPFGGPVLGGNKKYRQVLQSKNDTLYLTDIVVGDQVVKGIVDTGSFDLVLFPSYCVQCGSFASFDYKKSPNHTYGSLQAERPYGSGTALTIQSKGAVQIGPYHNKRQALWEVTSAAIPQLARPDFGFGAILGMGPPETPAIDSWRSASKTVGKLMKQYQLGVTNATGEILAAQAAIRTSMALTGIPPMLHGLAVKNFSLCLQQKPGADGYVIWEDNSSAMAPDRFAKVEVAGNTTWSVRMSQARLADSAATVTDLGCGNNCSAILDSGSSLLAMPKATVDKLEKALEASPLKDNCSDLWTLPDLAFELDGVKLRLGPDAYMMEVSGEVPEKLVGLVKPRVVGGRSNAVCRLMVMETVSEAQFGPLWILGLPFFRTYYTTFSMHSKTKPPAPATPYGFPPLSAPAPEAKSALYLSEASSDCRPAAAPADRRLKVQRRRIHPADVWVPESVLRASTAKQLEL